MNFLLAIILVSSLIYSYDAGDFQVYNQPDYLSLVSNAFDGKADPIKISSLTNNLATLLGLSSDETDKNDQTLFYSTNPLEIPLSIWLFHVEGIKQLSKDGILLDDKESFDIDLIHSKLRTIGEGQTLDTGSILITSDSDMNNLQQTLEKQISQMDKQALVKYIVIICDECNDEKAIEQLQKYLKTVLDQIIAKEPQTLAMTLATKESARVRRARQADNDVSQNVTIATMYSDEYPIMFNLFFWTTLVFALILISIVYVFLTLDPGADTIIYRMTAPRLKVD